MSEADKNSDTQELLPPPERIWLRANPESRFGVGAVMSPTPEPDYNIEYVRADLVPSTPAVDSQSNRCSGCGHERVHFDESLRRCNRVIYTGEDRDPSGICGCHCPSSGRVETGT